MSEQTQVEERSWYANGYVAVRREDVPLRLWVMLPYRRLVGAWEKRG